jgi:hypothetical protein
MYQISLIDITSIIIITTFITIIIFLRINNNSYSGGNHGNNNSNNISKNKNNNITEKFIVADANDFNNYETHRKKVVNKPDTFYDNKINDPLNKNKVDYDKDVDDKDFYIGLKYDFKPTEATKGQDIKDKKIYFSRADFGWHPKKKTMACANASVASEFRGGDKKLMPFQMDCTGPNKLTAENYWKVHNAPIVLPIEDTKVLGYNYDSFTNWVEPEKVDFRILSQTTKGLPLSERYKSIPVGFNYGFHNTPAMSMP